MANHGHMVSVDLPEAIFRKLRHVAEATHRSVEEVLATTVEAALPSMLGIPSVIANDLAALALYSDAALWQVVDAQLSDAQQDRIRQLTELSDIQPLEDDEEAELAELIDLYDQAVLRRAKAMALLTQRGFDVSSSARPTS
jgi:hypothetical protein